jgi:hypothetical protein
MSDDNYGPDEEWHIGGAIFRVYRQSGRYETYAVKRITDDDFEGVWLKLPESRYETLGGARIAILTYLESESQK